MLLGRLMDKILPNSPIHKAKKEIKKKIKETVFGKKDKPSLTNIDTGSNNANTLIENARATRAARQENKGNTNLTKMQEEIADLKKENERMNRQVQSQQQFASVPTHRYGAAPRYGRPAPQHQYNPFNGHGSYNA